jgi:hypothetical protein
MGKRNKEEGRESGLLFFATPTPRFNRETQASAQQDQSRILAV